MKLGVVYDDLLDYIEKHPLMKISTRIHTTITVLLAIFCVYLGYGYSTERAKNDTMENRITSDLSKFVILYMCHEEKDPALVPERQALAQKRNLEAIHDLSDFIIEHDLSNQYTHIHLEGVMNGNRKHHYLDERQRTLFARMLDEYYSKNPSMLVE
ncbi:hypothetical protein SAMN02745181_0384 [Rubritalea squalenifaciens DSM 18772]|uniref:Uncharacterized protein n=2 Tax=Rubritalea squalenifaciens TaxID=407226 RepID=A0A1M6C4H2_9BACT|nr:hypothetical protein SAMN02745181_0384 [Rubritalea squalenifaciens DSM 18772]